MKTAYFSVVATLLSLAAARPGVTCEADGGEVQDRASCQFILDNFKADSTETVSVAGSYMLGCETECYGVITAKDGNEITVTHADIHNDVLQILDTCGNGPFKGTNQVASGENARRTEIMQRDKTRCF